MSTPAHGEHMLDTFPPLAQSERNMGVDARCAPPSSVLFCRSLRAIFDANRLKLPECYWEAFTVKPHMYPLITLEIACKTQRRAILTILGFLRTDVVVKRVPMS